MKVRTIAIRPIWKLESRLFWFGFTSAARGWVVRGVPEDPVAVLLEEEVGLAQRRHTGRLGDVLHAEGRVVRALARNQCLAEGVARLTRLAVRLPVCLGRAVGIAVEDRLDDLVVRVGRQGTGRIWVGRQRVEDSRRLVQGG